MTQSVDSSRRRALFSIAGGAVAIPMAAISTSAQAANPVDESSPAAIGLKYKHDATAAPRVDKAGFAANTQLCSNCQFIQSDAGEWRPCTLFPAQTVNADGWCSAWMKKM